MYTTDHKSVLINLPSQGGGGGGGFAQKEAIADEVQGCRTQETRALCFVWSCEVWIW